jgi:hypothetical protein
MCLEQGRHRITSVERINTWDGDVLTSQRFLLCAYPLTPTLPKSAKATNSILCLTQHRGLFPGLKATAIICKGGYS